MKQLNFGCGKQIKEDFENVDIQKDKKIDKSFDFNKFPYPYKNNTFDYILVDKILEFIDNPKKVLYELHRICKKDGIIEVYAIYYHCRGSANDIKIKHRFNETTFSSMLTPHNHYQLEKKRQKFNIVVSELIPTRLGKVIYPKKLRWLLGCVIAELFCLVHIKLKIIK